MKAPRHHRHPYTNLELFGSELEPGDLIQEGDMLAMRQGFVTTTIPGTALKADNNNRYIRPVSS